MVEIDANRGRLDVVAHLALDHNFFLQGEYHKLAIEKLILDLGNVRELLLCLVVSV